jgi:26S proteasome regulatory subunit N11
MSDFHEEGQHNVERMKQLVLLAEGYEKRIKEETELSKDQLKTRYVGKVDPKKRKFQHHNSRDQITNNS